MFTISGQRTIDQEWNGRPITLEQNDHVHMNQTPNGTMIFAWENHAAQNNYGEIAVSSGGHKPEFQPSPAFSNQPSIWLKNWNANNLNVTNISHHSQTPICVQAIGSGIPGTTPLPLPIGNPGIELKPGEMAAGEALAQHMRLSFQVKSSTLSIVAFIGGPQDDTGNNGYVIALNYHRNSLRNSAEEPPGGYYATTTGSNYSFPFYWGAARIFVANMSPNNSTALSVKLIKL